MQSLEYQVSKIIAEYDDTKLYQKMKHLACMCESKVLEEDQDRLRELSRLLDEALVNFELVGRSYWTDNVEKLTTMVVEAINRKSIHDSHMLTKGFATISK